MSILSPKDKISQDSIPIASLNLRLETVDAAAKAVYRAPNKVIQNELLLVIEAALPEGYTEYTTAQGITVTRLDDRVPSPRICLSVERVAESDLCPGCEADLLTNGDVVDRHQRGKEMLLTVMCRECRQFVLVIEKRRI